MRISRNVICDAIAATVGIFLTFPLLMALFSRGPVVEVVDLQMVPDEAGTGDQIQLEWRVREHRTGCGGEVHRRFVDHTGRIIEFVVSSTVIHDLPTSAIVQPYSTTLTIPRGLQPGLIRYEPKVFRWCNWVQKLVWQMQDPPLSVPFTLTPSMARP